MKVDESRTEYEENTLMSLGHITWKAVTVFAPLYFLAHLVAFFM